VYMTHTKALPGLMPQTLTTAVWRQAAITSPAWVKSSLSFANGNYVEVANQFGGQVCARNRKGCRGRGSPLHVGQDEWHAFIGGVQRRVRPLQRPGGHGLSALPGWTVCWSSPHEETELCIQLFDYGPTRKPETTKNRTDGHQR
jgi:hypothetical protein